MKKYSSFYCLTITFILIAGLFFRLKTFLYFPSFWLDEASLLWNIENTDYKNLFVPLTFYSHQVAPPLFLCVEKFLYNFFNNFFTSFEALEFSVRLFPLITGCLSLPLFIYFVQKNFNHKIFTIMSSLFLSLNFIAINYCNELKQYSCEMFFGLLMLILFMNIDFTKNNFKKILAYTLICIISMWFSSTAIIFIYTGLVIQISYIIRNYDSNILKKYLLFLFPILINTLFFYFIYYQPNIIFMGDFMHNFWKKENAFLNINFINNFYLKTKSMLPFFPSKILFYITLLINLFIFYKKSSRKLFFMCNIPILVTIIASCLEKYPYENRLILFLLPLFLINIFQFLRLFGLNFFSKIILISIIIICNFTLLKLPTPFFIMHKSQMKELYTVALKYNPNNERMISTAALAPVYSRGKAEKNYNFKDFIKTNPKGEFFVIETYLRFYNQKDHEELLKFMFHKSKILIFIPSKTNPNLFFAKIKI